MDLKTKKLELEENAQIISMMESSSKDNFKNQKDALDRELKIDLKTIDTATQTELKMTEEQNKKEIKEMELMAKEILEENKAEMKAHEMDHQRDMKDHEMDHQRGIKEMELMVKDMIEERRLDFEVQREVSKVVNENLKNNFENIKQQDLNLMIQIAIDQVEENENDEEG